MRLQAAALDEFVIGGIETTIPLFTRARSQQPDIIDGDYNIHWLEKYLRRSEGPSQRSRMTSHATTSCSRSRPQLLLQAYACGVFPMAESARRSRALLDRAAAARHPPARQLPRAPAAGAHHPPGHLRGPHRQRLRRRDRGCAEPRPGRRTTWINEPIRGLYGELFAMRPCHSVECWQDGELVGGLYGVALGGAFFGESMFSTARDASKVALVHLCAAADPRRLPAARYAVHDRAPAQFGAIEIDRAEFHTLLERALAHEADFFNLPAEAEPQLILDLNSKASSPSVLIAKFVSVCGGFGTNFAI